MTHIDKIIRSKRKSIAIIIDMDGKVIVRAPYKASTKQINNFIDDKKDWVRSKKQTAEKLPRSRPKEFIFGEEFLFLGHPYLLEIVDKQPTPLILNERFLLSRSALPNAKDVFTKWYKKQAKKVITDRVSKFAQEFNYDFQRIRITSAKTRWGSCGSKGSLNFTWRLVMAPQSVIDYVVVHELVHIKVKNHSKEYWQQVEKIMPDYKLQKSWLNENGQLLTI